MGPVGPPRCVRPCAPPRSEARSRALSTAPALVGVRRSCKLFSRVLSLISETTQTPSACSRPIYGLPRRHRVRWMRARGARHNGQPAGLRLRRRFLQTSSCRKARASPRTICSRRAKTHGTWALERSSGRMMIRPKKKGVRRRPWSRRPRARSERALTRFFRIGLDVVSV